jgi:glycosyl transferase family 87
LSSKWKTVGLSLLIALAIWAFIYKAGPRMPDFEVYWRAAGRAAQAEPLYRATDGHFQFKYLPAFAVLAIPVGFLPLHLAKLIWFAISIGLLVLLLALNIRLPPQLRLPAPWLVFFTVITLGKFYVHEIVLGQVNLLFAVIATYALLAMKEGREGPAGVLVALAIVIKPYAVLFMPWLVARRQIVSILSACAGFAIALVLPVIRYGVSDTITLHREWWRTVTDTTAPNLTTLDNISLAAIFFRWFGLTDLSARLAFATAIVLLLIAAIVFLLRRGVTFPEGVEAGLLLTLMPMLSPQGWDYVFLIATPAIVFLINYRDRMPAFWRIAIPITLLAIGLSIFDLMGRTAYYAFMRMSIISWLFLVVIAALVTMRSRKIA